MIFAIKLAITILAIVCWFYSQKKIGERHKAHGQTNEIFDLIHKWTTSLNQKLIANPKFSRSLLISSSLIVDLLGIYLLYQALFGATIRPLLGLILLFSLRQLNQAVTLLPAPKGMIWSDPKFPSLFVTYGVSNDLFFSGHTALAVYGVMELSQLAPWLVPVAILIAFYEIATVLVLRAHWTMDVFAGAVTAFWIFDVASRLSPTLDQWFLSF
jgi:hypothetical protein